MAPKSVKIGTNKIKFDIRPLQALEREMKKKYVVKVGVLSGKTQRNDETGRTNADVGLVHEKGSKSQHIPRRSFIEMPLQMKLPQDLRKIGPQLMQNLVEENVVNTYKKLGVVAEGTIQKAFQTGGFGSWKPLRPKTIARKGSSAILIDTAQLRRSISSNVVEKS